MIALMIKQFKSFASLYHLIQHSATSGMKGLMSQQWIYCGSSLKGCSLSDDGRRLLGSMTSDHLTISSDEVRHSYT